MSRAWVHVNVDRIIRETEKALMVEIDGEEFWIPLSQIDEGGFYYFPGDVDRSIRITEWIAKEKGLSYEE